VNIKNVLKSFLTYYDVSRQSGHTTVMFEGIKNLPETQTAIVVAQNFNHAKMLEQEHQHPNVYYVTPYSADARLRGRKGPMLFDNFALINIFEEAYHSIEKLERDVMMANNKLAAIKSIL